ncbi:hypothetical protein QOZ80_3BG0280240 [Eleusine coracana subsp. coracana]|nr:hypothetical protein QOZ80_3BG0280240 [Eleusine coracana subsp. coracana]
MSSAASNPPSVNQQNGPSVPSLKRNSDDVGWEYGVLVDPNDLNVIQCKLCNKVVKAGIYRLKLHIAGKKGEVRSCPNATAEDKAKCQKATDQSSRAKKARRVKAQEVRNAVVIDVASDVEENTGLDEIGKSEPRVVGPMDNFTMPLEPDALSSGKKLSQPKISEHIMKDRLHKLKRYIARWLYVRGVPFNAINCEEFDQLLEVAGRFGPGAKKPYQHELREKLLYEEVEDTKQMLKIQEKEWAKNGCSIMTDAWTDQKRRSIMNLCVNCSIGTSFIEAKEVSSDSHTGELIFRYINSCIEKVGADHVVQVFEPLVKVLRMVDGDAKPSMAFLYGEILKAKKDIKVAIGNIDKSGTLYNSIMDIIHVKMNNRLDCPLHKAAYFLNPYYSYNDDSIFEAEEVMDGFFSVVETFYHCDYDKQSQVLNENVDKFKDRVGHFAKQVAQAGCKDFDFNPAKWWGNYGTQVRTLQKMAIRILSHTSSASGCERNWSCYEGIHTKRRNKLTCERLEQLVYVRFNALHGKKKVKAQKNKMVDPLLATEATHAQGWIVDGAEEDATDVEPTSGLTWKLIAETCGADEVTR